MTGPRPRALVTGASRGIGAAIAQELARHGHPLVVNYRSDEAGAREVAAAIEAEGGQAELAQFDVRERESTRARIAELLEAGEIGVLVSNAGVAQDAAFPAMRADQWDVVTRTSLDGFFNVTQPLVMPMVQRRWGRIVSISSISGVIGN